MLKTENRRRIVAAAAIIGGALGAVYLMLVVFLRIDDDLFPGNETTLPGVPLAVPGTNIGVDVPLPGISTSGEQPWTPTDRMNILVLGLDLRPGIAKDQPSRSDTIFIASIDKHYGRMQLLAIPRDLWAEVPVGNEPGEAWGEAKVNAAYSYGQFYKYPGGGAAAALAMIEHNFHLDIQHFVVIDWDGFVRLVDAIGGIDITVPEAVSDFGTDVLDSFPDHTVQAGPQHMTGEQALGYSRVRVDGDIKRIERQQVVIRAVAAQAVSLGLITRLPEFWSAYHDAIQTDIDTALVPGFALLARSLDYTNIETFSLAPATYSGIADDGELILLPNQDEMFAIIDQFLADPGARDEQASIAVEYAPGLEDAANEARDHLVAYGVPPEQITLLKGSGEGTSGIFDLNGKSYTATKLAQLFDLRLLNPEPGAPDGVDVLVRIGAGVGLKSP
ncbi:MAG TPA: LCP family protein [Tepidiformaceae bacterium]|nr:LCP family protein [Tepidiformaceae bacterium]